MRLIDADTLRAEFTGNFGRELWHYTGIRATIDVAPTSTATPHTVPCKECVSVIGNEVKGYVCRNQHCPCWARFVPPDFSCNCGERRIDHE